MKINDDIDILGCLWVDDCNSVYTRRVCHFEESNDINA